MRRQNPFVILLVVGSIIFAVYMIPRLSGQREVLVKEYIYSEFMADLDGGKIKSIKLIGGERAEGTFVPGAFPNSPQYDEFTVEFKYNPEVVWELRKQYPNVAIDTPGAVWTDRLLQMAGTIMLPLIILVAFWLLIMRQMRNAGGQAFQFGRSQAKLLGENFKRVTFDDVAGMEEVKEELQEVVEFLKTPERFRKLGAKIPRGVLLVGPPGCGKTLLARAVAGEAGVDFFYISGSDFVEMFVGVGASRVRDLFNQAKQHLPAIVFIDELDAVGRLRGAGLGGGHDEREQTLNALLVEMDGFDPNADVIILSATNRPDILDPALLRPGRFDRRVVVPNPDVKEREAILELYMKDKPVTDDVDTPVLAKRTPGFSGADLENLVNEAALLTGRRHNQQITMAEFDEGIERVIAGPERRSRVINERERKILAYHEAGHALVGSLLPDFDRTYKVTILPRGMSLGYTINLPKDDRYIMTSSQMRDHITQALGGRVAEQLVFGDVSTGGGNDLEKISELARQMVTEYGMSEELGPVTYGRHHGPVFLGKELVEERNYSEEAAQKIDAEVQRIVGECYERAEQIIQERRPTLDLLVEALLEHETLTQEEVEAVVERGELPEKKAEAAETHEPDTDTAPEADAEAEGPAPQVVRRPLPDTP